MKRELRKTQNALLIFMVAFVMLFSNWFVVKYLGINDVYGITKPLVLSILFLIVRYFFNYKSDNSKVNVPLMLFLLLFLTAGVIYDIKSFYEGKKSDLSEIIIFGLAIIACLNRLYKSYLSKN